MPLTDTETKPQLVRDLLQLKELVNRRLISHYFSKDGYNVVPTGAIIGVFIFVDESFSILHRYSALIMRNWRVGFKKNVYAMSSNIVPG